MKNKTLDVIKNRVSCRNFSEKKVSLKKALEIAETGKYAPSGKNRQIANIFVINSKRNVEKLRRISLELCGRDCMYGAKTIILVGAPRGDQFTFQDCSCILENMFVAATALKVDSCWINQLDELLKDPKYLKLRKRLGLSNEDRVVGSIILGYRKEGVKIDIKPRKEDFIKYL